MRGADTKLPSNRAFGTFFSLVFGVIAIFTYIEGVLLLAACSGLTSVLLIVSAVVKPRALTPLNKIWLRLGLYMGAVVNPMVLGVLFFGVITPMGILMRVYGRDELHLKETGKDTYWRVREEASKTSESFKRQF